MGQRMAGGSRGAVEKVEGESELWDVSVELIGPAAVVLCPAKRNPHCVTPVNHYDDGWCFAVQGVESRCLQGQIALI